MHDALRLAVRSALEAAKGELLPLALTSGTATWVNPEDPSSSGSSGWAAAGGSRLEAALSAAGVNMKLRARVRGALALVLLKPGGRDGVWHPIHSKPVMGLSTLNIPEFVSA